MTTTAHEDQFATDADLLEWKEKDNGVSTQIYTLPFKQEVQHFIELPPGTERVFAEMENWETVPSEGDMLSFLISSNGQIYSSEPLSQAFYLMYMSLIDGEMMVGSVESTPYKAIASAMQMERSRGKNATAS